MHTAKDTQFILQLLVTASDPESQAMIKALLRWGVRGPSQTPLCSWHQTNGQQKEKVRLNDAIPWKYRTWGLQGSLFWGNWEVRRLILN